MQSQISHIITKIQGFRNYLKCKYTSNIHKSKYDKTYNMQDVLAKHKITQIRNTTNNNMQNT